MRTVAIVQARLGSTRLPRKVLEEIGNRASLELLLSRLNRSKSIDAIVVAIADEHGSEELAKRVQEFGHAVYIGDNQNVMKRVIDAAKENGAEIVVRITGDCPFIDPALVDKVVYLRAECVVDYASNVNPATFPDGMDVEVFTLASLEKSSTYPQSSSDQEHVTQILRKSPTFRRANYFGSQDFSQIRLTLDEPSDLVVLRNVYQEFGSRDDFTLDEVTKLWSEKPHLFENNSQIMRNEGSILGTGQKLWKHAKNVIPGGNMLLSKRSEMFLPELWPSYFSKSKGCEVWDLDGNHYFDMSSMGVGTNSLGYGNEAVDEAVIKTVRDGNMSTLNCPEEVELADRLLDLNPWAGMVRLARTGGEANAIAIRVARAATGKSKIAICGYHGWHDWYLSANLSDQAGLDGHLLPGLQPNGVPRELAGTVLPFDYNDLEKLKEILVSGDVAAIKMEVFRSVEPKDDFLFEVRKLATENKVILIFDECTSGFRETFGGLHKKYGVEPDIAVYGKALGNGYAITAVVGRNEIMQAAQSSFISSTFWTERIGPTAAIAALSEMKRLESWNVITSIGEKIRSGWLAHSKFHGLDISIMGLPALSSFVFNVPNHLELKTYMTQEMLKRGFLASNLFYAATAHTDAVIEEYLVNFKDVMGEIKALVSDPPSKSFLDGPVSHGGFKRIN